MTDFFSDKLSKVNTGSTPPGRLFGSYDDRKNSYNLSFTNQTNSDPAETISFSERVNGWTSRMSFVPENGLSLNNKYFTFKNGDIYEHHSNTTHSKFYDVTLGVNDPRCTVKFIMTQPPGKVKRFKTLNYLGDTGWLLNAITTPETTGTLSTDGFIKKEGKFFATLKGSNSTASTLNAEELQVEGLGTLSSVNGSILTFTGGVNSNLQVGDNIYFIPVGASTAKVNGATNVSTALVVDNNSGTIEAGDIVTGTGISGNVTVASLTNQNNLVLSSPQTLGDNVDLTFDKTVVSTYTSSGTCTAKTATTVTVSGTAPAQGKFVLFDKGGVANQSGLLGFFADIELKHTTDNAAELFSVGSLVL